MLILPGTLRQSLATEYDGKKKTKIWLEHTSPRENGVDDLKMEELFIDGDVTPSLPKPGGQVSVYVRAYAVGKGVKYSAIALVGQNPPIPPTPVK